MIQVFQKDDRIILYSTDMKLLIDEALKMIRPKSRQFYQTELRNDLLDFGRCLIDRHAGNGRYIEVVLSIEASE